jgi:hypothetical protein
MDRDGWTLAWVQKDLVGNYPWTRLLATSRQLLEIAIFVGIDPNWASTILELFHYPPIPIIQFINIYGFRFFYFDFFSFYISCKNIINK